MKYLYILFNGLCIIPDPRVKNWPLMSGPIPVTFILVTYVYMIKCYLPEWMKNRPAFSLKTVINAYNIFQIIVNSIIFYGVSQFEIKLSKIRLTTPRKYNILQYSTSYIYIKKH